MLLVALANQMRIVRMRIQGALLGMPELFGSTSVHLPTPPVVIALAGGQKTLDKGRVRVADILRVYDWVEKLGRKNFRQKIAGTDKPGCRRRR